MTERAKTIPAGHHTITPQLTVQNAERAIEFYKRAFGAQENMRMAGPDGKGIMHAELTIGDSLFFLSDEIPGMQCHSPESLGGTPVSFYVYVDDVDATFARAVAAGADPRMPVTDMFWGDRFGKVTDPFGHEWGLATPKEKLTPEQMRERAKAWFAEMAAASHT